MYATRQVPRYQYGFPQYSQPMPRTAYNQPGGSVTTGPGQPQPSPYQQYMPTLGALGLKGGMSYLDQQGSDKAYDAAVKNKFGLDDPNPGAITEADNISVGHDLGNTYPGYYTGPEGTAASNTALDAESPYAANNLQSGGLLADTGAPAATAADATTAGSTVGAGAAGDAAAGTGSAAAGGAAADSALAADAGSGLLGADLAGGAAAADAGLLGTGAAAGGEAAAATAAGEGTAAAVGATNFWNPVGWAALAGLAAYQLGLFD